MYTDSGNRMQFRTGGGMLMLVGLPFFAFGLACLLATPLGLLPDSQHDAGRVLIEVIFGLVFAPLGLVLVLGRTGIIIDRTCKEVVTWWGLLVPFSKKTHTLDAFDIVTIERRVVRTDKRTRTIYPVALAGANARVAIAQPGRTDDARRLSERLGKFLNLGVRDSSSGTTIEREAGRLDESIRERVRRTDEKLSWPARPDGCQIVYERIGDEARFEIPRFGFHPVLGILMLVGAAAATLIVFFVVRPAWQDAARGDAIAWVLVALSLIAAAAPVIVLWGFSLAVMTAAQRIVVSRYELRVDYCLPLYTHTRRIPADELEELSIRGKLVATGQDAPPGKIVAARSDTTRAGFGCHRVEDARWMHDVIRYVIAGNRPE